MADNSAKDVWDKACKYLRQVLHPDVFSRWIAVIQPESLIDNNFTLALDNDFYQTWLEDNYLSLIKEAILRTSGKDVEIIFTIKPHQKSENVTKPAKTPDKKDSLRRRLTKRLRNRPCLNDKFVFNEFIVGPSNSFAHAASMAVAQSPARAYNPFFIYGGVGLGKTHLMQAIGHHILNTSTASVCYLSCEDFTNEYIDALQKRNLVQFRKKYRNTDLLLIDDIHFLGGKERLQEEFFHTFNALFDSYKQIVMSSDRPASEIAKLEQRLVSRFEWGLVTELNPPDLETRIAILRHKQSQTNMKLPDDILLFLAQNIRSNIRRLEGALIRAISYSSLTGRELTIETLRHLLRDSLEEEKHEEVTFDKIQRAVAEHFDVRLADMTSKRRTQAIAVPRQVAMYLCRRLTRSSLPDIATAFSKTHATILHAYRSVGNRMEVDPQLRNDLSTISKNLGHSFQLQETDKKL